MLIDIVPVGAIIVQSLQRGPQTGTSRAFQRDVLRAMVGHCDAAQYDESDPLFIAFRRYLELSTERVDSNDPEIGRRDYIHAAAALAAEVEIIGTGRRV